MEKQFSSVDVLHHETETLVCLERIFKWLEVNKNIVKSEALEEKLIDLQLRTGD